MKNNNCVVWEGASGRRYRFAVYAVDDDIDIREYGIYIFARAVPEGWEAVFISYGELKVEIAYQINSGAVMNKAPTHVHIHRCHQLHLYQSIVADLLAKHSEAYEPIGSNKLFY